MKNQSLFSVFHQQACRDNFDFSYDVEMDSLMADDECYDEMSKIAKTFLAKIEESRKKSKTKAPNKTMHMSALERIASCNINDGAKMVSIAENALGYSANDKEK